MDYCTEYPTLIQYFNLCDYSIFDLCIVGVGTLMWVVSYIAIIKSGFKNKFIEMPLFVAAGNIAWEFVWSFIYKTNMGDFYLWGYRAWFVLDLFILYLIFKYGAKQFKIPLFKKNTVLITIGLLVFFGFFFYYFAKGGYDTAIGATSAFFLSVGISTLYLVLLYTNGKAKNFSLLAGVTRAIGDTILTIFAIYYTEIGIIAVMGTYVVILDFAYVGLLWKMKREIKTNAAS
ncbi:MAG: hypothetical protein GQ574_12915 [Crocinitomix sp.]|nr:hypothetical protein [Crocinitomix sp.]